MTATDLNQLRTLVLLYETGSVTGTAERLHVTQPTVSYTLQRLRRRFSDELFRRTPHGLEPTHKTQQLYPSVREALATLDEAMESVDSFDPASTDQQFVLVLSDLGELTFLPPVMRALAAQAPHARVLARPLVVDDAERLLAQGRVDMVITSAAIPGGRLHREPFKVVEYAVIAAADHPRLAGRRLTPARFRREQHVRVLGTAGHTGPSRLLHTLGLDDAAVLEISSFSVLPHVVQETELLAMVPRHVAGIFAADHPLEIHRLPFDLDPIEVALHTRRQQSLSPAQRWFTTLVREALSEA